MEQSRSKCNDSTSKRDTKSADIDQVVSPSGGSNPSDQNTPNVSSAKVQFSTAEIAGGGEKHGGDSRINVKKGKRSFKDIVLREVIGTNQDGEQSEGKSKKRGILKLRSETTDSDKQSLCFVNQSYVGDDVTATDDVTEKHGGASNPSSGDAVSATAGSAFPFARRKSSHGFAGLIELLVERANLDSVKRDVHPFGTDSTVESMLEGVSGPKRNINSAYSQLVLWAVLLSILFGAAVGVIFLSEMYNAEVREENLLLTSGNDTVVTS